MGNVEAIWEANRRSTRYKLTELFNYIGQLSSQFPIAPLRVIYAASGTLPAASVLQDPRAAVEHKLYWGAPSSLAEAHYLVAIFNSETARARAEAFQSRGQFGARDFDKVMFNLPIPRFDAKSTLHRDLSGACERAEKIAAAVALPEGVKFQRARKLVRDALTEAGVAQEIDR